jgi:TonB family protein
VRRFLLSATLLLSCAAFAQQPLPKLPKTLPGVVNMPHLFQRPTVSPKPAYPDGAREHWVEGTITLDVVIGENGAPEQIGCDDYCAASRPDMVQAAADAVKKWRWDPVLVKGKPARVLTKVPVDFKLDAATPPISVCNLIKAPQEYIGKTLNVFGIVEKEHDLKIMSSRDCDGTIVFTDNSAMFPPAQDGKFAAMVGAVSQGPTPIAARGLFEQDRAPGHLNGFRLILDRVLKVGSQE